MKIQNLAIVFIVVIIPIIVLFSYYLSLQADTLEMQADYDAKLSVSVKEGIKAYEINTVNWRETLGEQRRNVMASMNTFLKSLSNNLQIPGTAKEYIQNYVPAAVMTLYDSYYIYAPTYVSKNIENKQGLQLYYNGTEITTDASTNGILNDVIYEPRSDATSKKRSTYRYTDEQGREKQEFIDFTTDATQAVKIYRHDLSNAIAYSGNYEKGTTKVTINYTLDNRIYVYGQRGSENIKEQGCLVFFDTSKSKIPRINIGSGATREDEIQVINKIDDTVYNSSNINAEVLTEQIVYKQSTTSPEILDTFKYIYDIESNKLYYDDENNCFFTLDANKVKKNIPDEASIKAGDEQCKYKSVSILTSDKTYKKLYQILNGRDKGKWYISLKDHSNMVLSEIGPDVEVIDTEIDDTIFNYGFSAIYMDYSAISYYVEAYAFTNWVEDLLSGTVIQNKVEVSLNPTTEKYEYTSKQVPITNLFKITENNDMEKPTSDIAMHKRQLMIDTINSSLNLSISNYAQNSAHQFQLPVLTDEDWEQVFSNISMIAFFQGVPIGLKTYNNYAIATSSLNRDYVDPNEIYFTGVSESYHRAYCTHVTLADIKEGYMGYRSVEYTLRSYTQGDKNIYYYQHTNQSSTDSSSDLACYYCLINKANYEKTVDIQSPTATQVAIKNIQAKAYREALGRERYYQNEEIAAKIGIVIHYEENRQGYITTIQNMPEDQEAGIGETTHISSQLPTADTNNPWLKVQCVGWALNPSSADPDYFAGQTVSFTEDVTVYAIWVVSLSDLQWNKDYKWVNPNEYWDESGHCPEYISDGSISNIDIDDNNNIKMVGNSVDQGKGATWTTIDPNYVKVEQFSFSYNVKRGDSFNAAGLMFNLTETSTTLSGYLFSINFSGRFRSLAGQNGAIFKFTYNKGANTTNMETLQLVQALNIGGGASQSGTLTIDVTNTGYIIKGSELPSDVIVNVDGPLNPNSFGFFSDHYSHGCNEIGFFKLSNMKIKVAPVN